MPVFVFFFFNQNWHFSCLYKHKRNVRTVRVWSCRRQRREMVSCRLGGLKCSVLNMAVHGWNCLSGLSLDEFQDLLTQSGQVLKAKTLNRCGILLVGLGVKTLMKKLWKENLESSLVIEWQNYPELFLGMSEATSEARDWPSSNGWSAARGKDI